MKKLNTILVPVDFSETTAIILEKAARLAEWNSATLVVLHVVSDDLLELYSKAGVAGASDRMTAAARKLVEDRLTGIRSRPIEIETVIAEGNIFRRIEETAQTRRADLLVLSAHDAEKKNRLGPIATRCARHLPGKILLVRDWHGESFRKIGACVDFSPASAEAFAAAVDVASLEHAELELIHLIYPPARDYYGVMAEQLEDSPIPHRDAIYHEVNAHLDEFLAPFRNDLENVSFRSTILESTHFSQEISSYLKGNDFDLAVIGTTGKSGVFGTLLGSNAERLIHDAPCSVLAVRPAKP